MNLAITERQDLTPPPIANGLGVWSRGDGTPGSATYEGLATAAFVPADRDFGGCLEILKTSNTQTLRYMGKTPMRPGGYLQIKARVKAISGNLPMVRIAGGVGSGAVTALTRYGEVIEIAAIARGGAALSWGHFGLDLTGPNGGVVRVDGIEITDITSAFLR